ncbi:MAG: hypothetical protein ACRDN9_18505 [Streptosporangiaceae bacterium]
MAFPPTRRAEVGRLVVGRLVVGDEPLIFTTRGCWHNPSPDRGRVIGVADVTSPVTVYDKPVEIAGREFTRGCDIAARRLAPLREGVELAPLVPRLEAFPDGHGWGIRLRRPLLELPPADASLVRHELSEIARDPFRTRQAYLDRGARARA